MPCRLAQPVYPLVCRAFSDTLEKWLVEPLVTRPKVREDALLW